MTTLPTEILHALDEASGTDGGGEIVVRGTNGSGRIYIYRGKIAWVACDAVKQRLGDLLQRETGIDREELRAVLAECQATKKQLGETLVSWGLIDNETLRGTLLLHNATHLLGLSQMGSPLRALFIPMSQTYAMDFVFELDELVGAMTQQKARAAAPVPVAPDASSRRGAAALVPEGALAKLRDGIPHCDALMAVDIVEPSLISISPPEAFNIDDRTRLVESITDFVRSAAVERLEAGCEAAGLIGPPLLQRTVFVADDCCLIVRRSERDPGVVIVAACKSFKSLGMVLSMSQNKLAELDVVDD